MKMPALLTAPRKKLDEQAHGCRSQEEFLNQRDGVHWLELHPEGRQNLAPALWKGAGAGALEQYASRTRRLPSVRIYGFCDSPLALGNTAIVNAGDFLELDYLTFCETSRFYEFSNVSLVESFEPNAVTFRIPTAHLRIEGDCALITQQGDQVWGHWLVDVLPRIKLVRRVLPDITLVVSDALGCSADLLEQAGIDLRKVIFYDPLKSVLTADRMFFPSFLRFANAFSPLAGDIFPTLSSHEKQRGRKLYVTRSRTTQGSTLLNHEEIQGLFLRRGFEVISPETISVDAQLRLFAQASHIAGEYGSGLHNSIFSPPGTPVMCLQSENIKQFVQAGIGAVTRQPTGFVFGECRVDMQQGLNKAPSHRDRYCHVHPALVEQGLDEFLQL